jgi:putative phosphoesterase
MTRIGIISDNHSRTADGSDVPQQVLDAFAGADLIVHCGDAGSWGTLDRLETVAPVLGVRARNGQNGQGDDRRIEGDKRVIDLGGLRAGVVHDLVTQGLTTESHPALKPVSGALAEALAGFFGEPIDVLLYGGTHVPRVGSAGGVLLVNPGSPTLPGDRPKPSLGAVAIVEVEAGITAARVVELWREPSA